MKIKEAEKIFKALGQSLRLKIIALLAEQEFCVCELEEIFGVSQPAISQHLRVLKEAGLVEEEKIGQWVFYSLKKKFLENFLQDFSSYLFSPLEDKKGLEQEKLQVEKLKQNPKVSCRPVKR
ncbi:ArsR family transcriptional regulator [Thermanaeromonas toyohensis ToBE]|uniref:ArsR family transcriptional regulator n=1 Tax=Thermanaeromonas toyohensis ToBE TaxID=698762 RepID=A0A1W1VYX0_9FIRM|nr:metalloregulator ArsR/SmtB family transcription factor [Thermanaeromonas toyohensis]SMB98044.1 ArsR family transcriptional regulator [Thermanaeromonas toyohensis ToBE]